MASTCPCVVAESVGKRFEDGEGLNIGLRLGGVHASRLEGNRHGMAGFLRSPLDACATGKNDQIGKRDLLAAGLGAVELALDALQSTCSTFASCAGWLTSQSFCGDRRIRAPFAPPRLSEPRKVDADAQAVKTSCETVRPEARILRLRAAMSFSPISL